MSEYKNKITLPEFLTENELQSPTHRALGCYIACQTGLCGECMSSRQSSLPQDKNEGYNTRPGAPTASGNHANSSGNSNKNSNSSNSSSSGTFYPPNLSDIDSDKVTTGTVIIKREDGTTQTIYDCPKYEGAFYDPDTGEILGDTHGPDGKYDQGSWDKAYDSTNNVGYFTEKPSKKHNNGSGGSSGGGSSGGSSSGSSSGSWTPPPPPPPPPPKIEWDEPFPVFKGDLKKIYRYVYHLGLDEAAFSNVIYESNSVCVTPLIEIGQLEDESYIALEAFYKGNIEFYIIDGTLEIPIMPLGQTQIEDEKLFYGLSTRFIVNDQAPILVKQNGTSTDCDYHTILNDLSYWKDNTTYHISYTPIAQYHYKPVNNRIQIKAIIRGIGSIQKMTLRHYGDTYYKD